MVARATHAPQEEYHFRALRTPPSPPAPATHLAEMAAHNAATIEGLHTIEVATPLRPTRAHKASSQGASRYQCETDQCEVDQSWRRGRGKRQSRTLAAHGVRVPTIGCGKPRALACMCIYTYACTIRPLRHSQQAMTLR